MQHPFGYRGHAIIVVAEKISDGPEQWQADYTIDGAKPPVQHSSPYPPKLCDSQEAALEYAMEGAKWAVDNPPHILERAS